MQPCVSAASALKTVWGQGLGAFPCGAPGNHPAPLSPSAQSAWLWLFWASRSQPGPGCAHQDLSWLGGDMGVPNRPCYPREGRSLFGEKNPSFVPPCTSGAWSRGLWCRFGAWNCLHLLLVMDTSAGTAGEVQVPSSAGLGQGCTQVGMLWDDVASFSGKQTDSVSFFLSS